MNEDYDQYDLDYPDGVDDSDYEVGGCESWYDEGEEE